MDAIIRMLRPGPAGARPVRRRTPPDNAGLALHPMALWGRVCVTPGAEFITTPHAENDQTWLFYPDSSDAPRRAVLLETNFSVRPAPDHIDLARSLTRTLQRSLPATTIHTNALPLRIVDVTTEVEYLEWEDQPLEQLRFIRGGRRITLAGWRSIKPLPVLVEEDLHTIDASLLDALTASG